ncbi:MAG TPA: hypothetical protein VGO97_02445 [Solirubrobacterales bacterium]|jgi:hypothetical protein|nr:hypothetical protein [Solirubrobacterales bacterium]
MNAKASGQRPDLTPAQAAAVVIGGVPLIANLLFVFGVFDGTFAQTEVLRDSLTWGVILAGLLILGDAALRMARNSADAVVKASALASTLEAPDAMQHHAHTGEAADPLSIDELATVDTEADRFVEADLPSDEEELEAGPPSAGKPAAIPTGVGTSE